MQKAEDRAQDRQAAVLNILSHLRGLDPLKELFWHQLNYERINEPILRRGWSETAATALVDDPVVFACGGGADAFKIILARLDSDRVRLGLQRPVIGRLLRDFPYALFVFSNRDRDAWHFVNVKLENSGQACLRADHLALPTRTRALWRGASPASPPRYSGCVHRA